MSRVSRAQSVLDIPPFVPFGIVKQKNGSLKMNRLAAVKKANASLYVYVMTLFGIISGIPSFWNTAFISWFFSISISGSSA